MAGRLSIGCWAPKLTPTAKARLEEIERGEPRMADLSDDELRRKTEELKERLRVGGVAVGRS
jgi:preprotein translocase subunit SecA